MEKLGESTLSWKVGYRPRERGERSSKTFAAALGRSAAFPFPLPLEGREEDPPGSSRAVRNTG